jgi:hypothetical protein
MRVDARRVPTLGNVLRLRRVVTLLSVRSAAALLWVSNCQFSRQFQDWATLRGARPLTYADSRMKNFVITLLHFAVVTAKLCGPVACEP